jgi:hypothetical protein
MRTRLLDELATLRIAAGPSRRKLLPEELQDEIERQESGFLENGDDDDDDPGLDPGDQQDYSPSRGPMDDDPEEITNLDDDGKDGEEDGDEDEDDDDDEEEKPASSRRTKAERRLHELAVNYASAHGVTYNSAFARVLRSPRGQRLYQAYFFSRGV